MKFKGELLKAKLWKAAKASTTIEFNATKEEIRELNEETHKCLLKKPASQWWRSHFSAKSKCDIMLNNLCEYFNGEKNLLEVRVLHIYTMLERIRFKMMKRWENRRKYI